MSALHIFFDTPTLETFQEAYAFSRSSAIVLAFHMRDITHGRGERELFRQILQWLADTQPLSFTRVIQSIPTYGRWDDLLIFGAHRRVSSSVQSFVRAQWRADCQSEIPSLLAKYLPSENASSDATKALADIWMRILYLGPFIQNATLINRARREYRQELSRLRKQLGIVECYMSAGEWDKIDYASIPRSALSKYHRAFMRHDSVRYSAYMRKPIWKERSMTVEEVLSNTRYRQLGFV